MVKRWLVLAMLLGACGGGLVDGWKKVTAQPRPTFTNPGDVVTMSPTADVWPYDGDPDRDCASCLPR